MATPGTQRVTVERLIDDEDQGQYGRQYTCFFKEQDGEVTLGAITGKGFVIEEGAELDGHFALKPDGKRKCFPRIDESGSKTWVAIFQRYKGEDAQPSQGGFKTPNQTKAVQTAKALPQTNKIFTDDLDKLADISHSLASKLSFKETSADCRAEVASKIFVTLFINGGELAAREETNREKADRVLGEDVGEGLEQNGLIADKQEIPF